MSMMSEIFPAQDGASVSTLENPSMLMADVDSSVAGAAVDRSMATTSTQGRETRSEDWTMGTSLADGLSALSLDAFSVSTLGGGIGNEAILNGAETPHEATHPTISAPRSTGTTYPSAATRPGVNTPGTSNTSHESLHTDNPHGSESKARFLADIEDAIHRALDGGIGQDKVQELIDRMEAKRAEAMRAEAMRASSNDDGKKPAAREGTRVRTESDSRMESIAEETYQPMGSVADSSSVSVPHSNWSDFEPRPFNANRAGTMQDYSMDQMGQNSSATFQDNVARMPSDNVNVQQNGFMYEPSGSEHPYAHSPIGDTAALRYSSDFEPHPFNVDSSYYHQQTTGQHGNGHHLRPMVSTERYESNHSDLSVYPNLSQPAVAVPRPLIGLNVVKITNRAPSEAGAHGDMEASFVSPESSGEVSIYLFVEGLVGSRMFYKEFKRRRVSFASAPDRAQKGKIHGKLMADVTSLDGKFLKPAALGGVNEMSYLETRDALEAFLEQKCYVDCNHNLDVLMGRGGHSTNNPGNQRYLVKRDEMRQDYVRLEDDDAKNQMGQNLVNWVYANGGRFVTNKDDDVENGVSSSDGKGNADKGNADKGNASKGKGGKGKDGKGNDRWYILKNKDARSKAKQALREGRSPRRTI